MSLTVWLDFIRKNFSPEDGRILVKSLQQDPLVWGFLQEEEFSSSFLLNTSNDLRGFAPGKMAAWLIEFKTGFSVGELNKNETILPANLKGIATQALETVFNTGLPPADLYTAGLIALTLLERRIRKESWKGLADEIFVERNFQSILKNYRIWQTPFTCVYYLSQDFSGLIDDCLSTTSETIRKAYIPILLHALIANPMPEKQLMEQLFEFIKQLPIDSQLESLHWLKNFKQEQLQISLAKQLLQTKNIRDFLSHVFSEVERFETINDEIDPLEKSVSFSFPEDVNRLAAFYSFSGNERKAVETYQKASDILEFLKTQALFQSFTDAVGHTPPTRWLEIINSVPHSKQARLFYARSLIEYEQYEEALQQLKELPESPQRQLLLSLIPQNEAPDVAVAIKSHQPSRSTLNGKPFSSASYFVHEQYISPEDEIINAIKQTGHREENLRWLEKYLIVNPADLRGRKIARDLFEKAGQISKSIELTSYLERIEPENIEHKRALVRLYGQADLWYEAFAFMEALINSEGNDELEDLEMFAESAVRTKQTEVAVSVCQNILKKNANNPKALVLLGEIYHQKGDALKAIQHMENVVDLLPEEPEAWMTLAWLWAENNQTDRSLETIKKGVTVIPDQPKLLRALGKAEDENQNYSEALTAYQQAYALEPDHLEGRLALANVFYRLDQPEQAFTLLEGFSNNFENYPKIAKLLGQVLLAMNQLASAEPILLFAAEEFPEDFDIVTTALHLILDRVESDPEIDPTQILERAGSILSKSAQIQPEHAVIKRLHADINRLNEQYQSAFDIYSELSKVTDPQTLANDWRLKYGLGQTAIHLGHLDIGLASLQDALAIHPDNLIIRHAIAHAFQVADLPGKANAMAKSALVMAPQDLNNILWYAKFKSQTNDLEEAIRALKEALQLTPQHPELRLWLAKLQISSGVLEDAHESITEFITFAPQNPHLLQQAAYVCVHLNDLEKAIFALENALKLSSKFNPVLLMDLATVHSMKGDHEKAFETLDVDQNLISQHPQIALLQADLLIRIGQYENAYLALLSVQKSVENAIISNDKNSNLRNNSPLLYSHDLSLHNYDLRLGYLLRALGRFEEAKKHLGLAFEKSEQDYKLKNAYVEAAMVDLDQEPALAFKENNFPINLLESNEKFDFVDLVCSQVELLLYKDDFEQASERFKLLSDINFAYPRCLAIQSRFTANSGNLALAKEQLNEAIKLFESTDGNNSTTSLPILFRKMVNLHSIAEASLAVENYVGAIQAWLQLYEDLETQPLFNWRYLFGLVTAAESQQTSNTLSVIAHAPGQECLDEIHFETAKQLLTNLEDKLPQEQIVCLKARVEAAFTGTWPVHLNVDACLQGPKEAAAVLIGSEEDNLIQDILDSYPDHIEVLQAYGIYALRHKLHNAIPYIERAIEIEPDNPINHALLAYLNLDQPEQSLNSINTALSIWPDEPEWHIFAADLHKILSNPEMAEKHIQKALDCQPENANYWQKSAVLNIDNKNLGRAKSDLERSTTLQPNNPKSWAVMAEVNRLMGDPDDAIVSIRKATQLAPDDQEMVQIELQLLLEQKRFLDLESKARAVLTKDEENETARVFLARALACQGKFDQALSELNQILEKEPNNANISLEYFKIKKDQIGVEKTLPDLILLAKDNPDQPSILITLSDWLIQTNRIDEAEKVAQTTLRLVPDQAEVYLMLGRMQRAKGKLDQAIDHLSQAIVLDNNLVEAYLELGKTYHERRELDKAIEIYEKGSQVNKSDSRPYYYAGLALKDIKDYFGAELMFKQAKKYSPDDNNIIRQLGVVTALNLVNNLREAK